MARLWRTFKGIRDAVAWHARYGPQAPKEGDPAPDFELRDAEAKIATRLSSFKGKKSVALVFGSFT